MKSNLKSLVKFAIGSVALCLFMVSCSSDDGSVFQTPTDPTNPTDPAKPEVATLIFNEANPSVNVTEAAASGAAGTKVPGRVIFTSSETNQRRMYITQNVSGQGDMPFSDFALEGTDLKKALKGDGSIDLDGSNKKEIDFTFELSVPDIDNGKIVYSFWTTKGKGDFRDSEKRRALGVGTITVTVGNGTNPAAAVRSFTKVQLNAPAADGTSKSFFSLLNETVYQIDQGPEFRAFWDFGYYYKDNQASFASTANYDAAFGFPVQGLKPAADEENAADETLNTMFFAKSTMDAAGFDGVTLSGDLDNITSSNVQDLDALAVGDVIEFVDNYGKKGLIKITELSPGFNVDNFVVFEVKVQP